MKKKQENYSDLLQELKTCFPSPLSNPIMDGYFVHTISHFLDHIDSLKCIAPVLGIGLEKCLDIHKDDRFLKIYGGEQHEKVFPEEMSSVEKVTELLGDYCKGMLIWAHPNAQVNVVGPPPIPSIMAFMATAIYNPNIIEHEVSARFSEAEIESVAMLSDLIGYEQQKAGGIFTFGGTGTNLYGCKIGIEKMFNGRAMRDGIREDVKIVVSDSSHYSRLNVAGWLGLGTRNVVTIPTTGNNEISIPDLQNYLRHAFESGEKVAVIMPTMGTTDAFGIDDLAAIVRLRDRMAIEYELDHPPHIHADSVIGWAWTVFLDYDFKDNPLGFHSRTLRSLEDSVNRIKYLYMADSLGIDFHKTGYAPYISSCFLVKDRHDLDLLSRAPDKMPYLYQFGNYHPGIFTLETSRSGAGALAAIANMRLFGKQGYRVLIGHVVEMAEMLRERLESYLCVHVLNDYNYGPVTLFRVYPEGLDAKETFSREMTDPEYQEQMNENNSYNRRIFNKIHEWAMRGECVLLSWTDAYRHADYPGGPPVSAIKSFIMSPWTDLKAVDMVVSQVLKARVQIEKES